MSTEVVLVWRTDVHLSDTPPVSRIDDWTETVFDKLKQVGQIASKVNAHAVLDGGDFFHIKSPARTSHKTIRKVAEIHRDHYNCPVYGNVGNHDCVHGSIRWLPQQPLGVLFETGVFQRLYDEHEAVFEENGVKVRVVGVPYHGTRYDLTRFEVTKGDEDFLVLVAHVLASEAPSTMFDGEDIVSYDYLEGLEADVFCFGHWHKDQGTTEIRPGKWVVNVGSLTRGSLSQDHLGREPACVVLRFSSEGVQVERRNLAVRSPSEVFNVKGRVRQEARAFVMDNFAIRAKKVLSGIQKESEGELGTVLSLEDVLREMKDLPEVVREEAILILERARS